MVPVGPGGRRVRLGARGDERADVGRGPVRVAARRLQRDHPGDARRAAAREAARDDRPPHRRPAHRRRRRERERTTCPSTRTSARPTASRAAARTSTRRSRSGATSGRARRSRSRASSTAARLHLRPAAAAGRRAAALVRRPQRPHPAPRRRLCDGYHAAQLNAGADRRAHPEAARVRRGGRAGRCRRSRCASASASTRSRSRSTACTAARSDRPARWWSSQRRRRRAGRRLQRVRAGAARGRDRALRRRGLRARARADRSRGPVTEARIVVGITGASGAIYGVRLLERLRELPVETHLIATRWARVTIEHETGYTFARGEGARRRRLRRGRPGRGRLERLVPDRRHGDRPVQREDARRDRQRLRVQPDLPRRRRRPEGAPPLVLAVRETPLHRSTCATC